MTHPIPGADSELPRAEQVLRRLLAYRTSGGLLYTDDGELQDNSARPWIDFKRDSVDSIEENLGKRAAAKVGANVAAPDVYGLNTTPVDAQKSASFEHKAEAPIAWMNPNEGCVMDAFIWSRDPQSPRYSVPVYSRLAAGAPAETPLGVIPASVDLDAPGEVNEKLLTYLNTADQTAPAETPKPVCQWCNGAKVIDCPGEDFLTEICQHCDGTGNAAQPAPIAGDVEKYVRAPEDDEIMPDGMPRRLAPGWQR